MFYNYIKIAFRHLTRNSVYSFINIAGLSVGIACAILILLWVTNELSYDRFQANYDQLYKVELNQQLSEGINTQPQIPFPLKEAIRNKSSQIKYTVLTNWGEGNLLTVGDKGYNKYGISATEDFFKMFSFNMIAGDPNTALTDPTSMVITEATAKTLFGNNDPMNQLIKIDNNKVLKVTGVVKDVPVESAFKFDYVFPFAFYEATQPWVKFTIDNWKSNSFQMYALLQPNAQVEIVNASIKNLIKENNPDGKNMTLFLHPMSQWRLYSKFENGKAVGGLIDYVQLFSAIAILVLIIACINFMNLSTARSESRAREVGIRKSVGSRRKELIAQFLGESIFISFIGLALAICLVELSLPFYNELVGKKLFVDYADPLWILAGATLVLGTGLIAGSYPAFYLSNFQPAKVLKGKILSGKNGSSPRKVLVTLQFGFSIFLIIGTFVIYQQIMHVKNREVGYDRENLMLIWTTSDIEANFTTLRDELLRTGEVKAVCKSNSPITKVFSHVFSPDNVQWKGMDPSARISFVNIGTEYDYTETLGIKILEGRDFSRDFKSDSSAIVINKAALDVMGLKDPIGEKVTMWGNVEATIIGVMENVVMDDPAKPVEPLIMIFNPTWSSTVAVRMNKAADFQNSISKIESVFKKYGPAYPFEYRFADAEFDRKFSTISLIGKLASLFASLAIVITCLGLFGLAAFTAEQRSKEIGIRKVMGASVSNLILLISKDFSRLVIFAFIFSAPFAWWALNNFLEQYPYRVEIQWWVLPVAGIIALMLALIIVSTQALRAATSDPIKSLRSE
jgi:putative ABC transport system permease protein